MELLKTYNNCKKCQTELEDNKFNKIGNLFLCNANLYHFIMDTIDLYGYKRIYKNKFEKKFGYELIDLYSQNQSTHMYTKNCFLYIEYDNFKNILSKLKQEKNSYNCTCCAYQNR